MRIEVVLAKLKLGGRSWSCKLRRRNQSWVVEVEEHIGEADLGVWKLKYFCPPEVSKVETKAFHRCYNIDMGGSDFYSLLWWAIWGSGKTSSWARERCQPSNTTNIAWSWSGIAWTSEVGWRAWSLFRSASTADKFPWASPARKEFFRDWYILSGDGQVFLLEAGIPAIPTRMRRGAASQC